MFRYTIVGISVKTKQILQILIPSLILSACAQVKVIRYNSIVDQVTQVEIGFKNLDKKIALDKTQVEHFKVIAKRGIEPEMQKKFGADIQIDLYDNDSRIGFLIITENGHKPFVNFVSDDLNFGFQLTYGIGQYLNELKHKYQHRL